MCNSTEKNIRHVLTSWERHRVCKLLRETNCIQEFEREIIINTSLSVDSFVSMYYKGFRVKQLAWICKGCKEYLVGLVYTESVIMSNSNFSTSFISSVI